jgi:hypothetical protein
MLKKIFFFLICCAAVLQATDITILPSYKNIRFDAEVNNGFSGDRGGNIEINIEKTDAAPQTLYAIINEPLTSADGYDFQDDALQWSVYGCWGPSTANIQFFSRQGSWNNYRQREVKICELGGPVNATVLLGTTLRRVPSVQPNGLYTTEIKFYVEP